MTKVGERMVTPGFQNSAPRTAGDFAKRWQVSATKQELSKQIAQYQKTYPIRQGHFQDFANSLRQQTQSQRSGSPYTLSYRQQVELCLWRGFRRLVGDPSLTITQLLGNFLMALILGSIFYDMQPNTETFYGRGSLLFFAVLLNAFGSALEV
jgi:ATP-binding cassette subfamily G (WHITE) protein 2 (PDR)